MAERAISRKEAELPVGEARWDRARGDRVLGGVKRTVDRKRRGRAVAAALAVVTLVAATLVFMVRPTREAPPLVRREVGSLRFLDGSRVDLVDGASTVEVGLISPSYTELELAKGSARFDVTPNPGRRFAVRAGDLRVEVLGTRFTVERLLVGEDPKVRVAVERGRVRVIWPGGERVLAAGEAGLFPPASPDATRAAEPAPETAAIEAEPFATTSAVEPASDPSTLRSRFRDLARRGEYQKAYGVVHENPAVVTNSAEDLMLAADAARLSGHPERALEYLRRITTSHRDDSRAPLAAFTLGRILLTQLGQPGEAERAFALTRELAPRGALAAGALAREVEAAERAGHHARARILVEEYTKKYPASQHLDAVRRHGGLEPAER
jgi:transmembrane sensor